MTITKVWVEDECTACGVCVDICPEVFAMEDAAVVIKGANFSEFDFQIKDAAGSCPVEVIKYSE